MFDAQIHTIGGARIPWWSLLVASILVMAVVAGLLIHQTSNKDMAHYRVISTVNYGELFLDGTRTPWLDAPITLLPGEHTLVLHAIPFTIACSITLPHRATDDCPIDEPRHTLTLAPRIAHIAQSDITFLSQWDQFPSVSHTFSVPPDGLYRTGQGRTTAHSLTNTMSAKSIASLVIPGEDYGNVPGAQEERQRQSNARWSCPQYPFCDATPQLPDSRAPATFLIVVPLYLEWQMVDAAAQIAVESDAHIVQLTLPLTYHPDGPDHWQILPSLYQQVLDTAMCDYARATFIDLAEQQTQQTVVLSPDHSCQADITLGFGAQVSIGGRLVIQDDVTYLDPLAHQMFPDFPTFAQQIQGGTG